MIKRKLFWQKNGKKILAIGIVSILLLTALAILSWKVFFQGKGHGGQGDGVTVVSGEGQGENVTVVSGDGQGGGGGSGGVEDDSGGQDGIPDGQGGSFVEKRTEQTLSQPLCIAAPEKIPAYAGENYVILSDNLPEFNLYDLEHVVGENYSELDSLGRCGPAIAMLHNSMMPTEKR